MPNRLADATSPYLLQHKDNPVDWHQWGDEAFEEARSRDVPVLLSVGYAACHWCHVMAHESFEDEPTASVMNRLFVNVKVDREERPDVDSIYMESVQAMSGHGGWPMTVWLDHDGRPFYAGTYFPKERRQGMASFIQVMTAVSEAWVSRRDEVDEQATRLVEAVSASLPRGPKIDESTLQHAYRSVEAQFDDEWGGLGRAPKFPQQPVLEFLLRVHEEPWAIRAEAVLSKTLTEMARGGIHDQLAGGFARYSVDNRWLVPHFEKMLYDNAQLARLYLWAGVEFENHGMIAVARRTLEYMNNDLRLPGGGFYSSEDADSEGVEGKFYVWTLEELREILEDEADEAIAFWGATSSGNFEGSNILHMTADEEPPRIDQWRKRLLEARNTRVRPGLDDKVITAWNGLAIRSFAEAGAALGEERYIEVAVEAASFVLDNLRTDGRLMRSWRDGRTSVPAFLDDHSSLATALFALYAATGDLGWYREADQLVSELERFRDPDTGAMYGTSLDGEALYKRPSDQTDNPLPSGSALAAEALMLRSLYTGSGNDSTRASEVLAASSLLMNRHPTMVGHHLAVSHSLGRSRELALVGRDLDPLRKIFWSRFRPHIALATSADGAGDVPLLANRYQEGETLAYLCKDFVCELPVSDPEKLADLMS